MHKEVIGTLGSAFETWGVGFSSGRKQEEEQMLRKWPKRKHLDKQQAKVINMCAVISVPAGLLCGTRVL